MVEMRTAATPLSMRVSAQATRVKGSTLSMRASRDVRPTMAGLTRGARRSTASTSPTVAAPRNMRPATSSEGEISSTMTFMNKKARLNVNPG
jgi:hypothetical protein